MFKSKESSESSIYFSPIIIYCLCLLNISSSQSYNNLFERYSSSLCGPKTSNLCNLNSMFLTAVGLRIMLVLLFLHNYFSVFVKNNYLKFFFFIFEDVFLCVNIFEIFALFFRFLFLVLDNYGFSWSVEYVIFLWLYWQSDLQRLRL